MTLRFKRNDGSNFPDWEEKKLGDVGSIIKGDQINKTKLFEKQSIVNRYKFINGGVEPSGYYHSYNTPANTITISEGGASTGFVNLMREDFWAGGHCYTLLNIKSNIDTQYLFQFLKHIEKDIMSRKVGTGIPNLQKKDVSIIAIQTPIFQEQHKIATCLSDLDNLIEQTKEKLEKYKELKKSLMQHLFT